MQNINLYLPELRPKQEWLTPLSSALILFGFVCLMSIAWLWQNIKVTQFEEQVALLAQQKEATVQRVERIKARSLTRSSHELDVEIEALRRVSTARSDISKLIVGQQLGNAQGYHKRMLALAEHANANLRLDAFRFTRGAAYTELRGVSTSPDVVTNYLRKLIASPSFAKSQFGQVSVVPNLAGPYYKVAIGYEQLFDETLTIIPSGVQ